MNIVISPHPDDCLIGCYSLIKKGLIDEVVYLDATPERWRLAKNAGKELGFGVGLMPFQNLYAWLCNPKLGEIEPTFLVPDISDNHVLHKFTNCAAKLSGCNLGYYSVDMSASFVKELSQFDQKEKRAALNKYYPDQKSLWESNWKYFLFEGIVFEENNG